jgi:hypothetical protein
MAATVMLMVRNSPRILSNNVADGGLLCESDYGKAQNYFVFLSFFRNFAGKRMSFGRNNHTLNIL